MEMCRLIMNGSKIKELYRFIKKIVGNIYYRGLWVFSYNRITHQCLNKKRSEKIIVSLTSFPGRIELVHFTIESILNQKEEKPDAIQLWLAESQFPQKEMSLPYKLLKLQDYGLSIRWCEDIRSYKKLIPTLKENPNNIIVTTDDDVFYRRDWLKLLYESYQNDPLCIHCHRVTKFYLDESGNFKTIPGGYSYYKEPSYLNKLVGIGGVLYPPKVLFEDIIKTKLFMELAPTNDDIWFWLMGVLEGTKVKVVAGNNPQPVDVFEAAKTDKLMDINDKGNKLFWVQFNNILQYYPNLKSKLIKAYNNYSLL